MGTSAVFLLGRVPDNSQAIQKKVRVMKLCKEHLFTQCFLFTPFPDRQPEKWFKIVFVALRQEGLIASALSHPGGRNSEHSAMLPVGLYEACEEDGAVALKIKYFLATFAHFSP